MLICGLELETNCLAGTMDVSYTLCNEARVVSIFILSLSSSCYYYHDYSLSPLASLEFNFSTSYASFPEVSLTYSVSFSKECLVNCMCKVKTGKTPAGRTDCKEYIKTLS